MISYVPQQVPVVYDIAINAWYRLFGCMSRKERSHQVQKRAIHLQFNKLRDVCQHFDCLRMCNHCGVTSVPKAYYSTCLTSCRVASTLMH